MGHYPKFGRGKSLLSTLFTATALLAVIGCSSAPVKADTSKAIVGEASCQRNADVGTITYISGYGYSASAGQMDVFLADELGYFDALCLDVEINAAGVNGQQLVASGQAEFTELGSASDVMLAAANSGNLTAVATYGTESPFSIFTNEDIKTLKDLEGKKLGYFINLTPVAVAMLDAAGVDIDSVELIKMTNYDPTVVTRGQVDAVVGYASNQPELLRSLNLPFNEFFPSDYGLGGTYNVMEVNSQFLAAHRETTADFMRASLKALEYCLVNEDECVTRLAALAEQNNQGKAFPKDQLARTWAVESEWVRSSSMKAPGVPSVEAWNAEATLVLEFGGVSSLPPVSDMLDPTLVADLYVDGTLDWPGE